MDFEQSLAAWSRSTEISEGTLKNWATALDLHAPFDTSKVKCILAYGIVKGQKAKGATADLGMRNAEKAQEALSRLKGE